MKNSFQAFVVLPHIIKELEYIFEVGSYKLPLIQKKSGHSQDIIYKKSFWKDYKEMAKIWAILYFLTSISIEKSLTELTRRGKRPK